MILSLFSTKCLAFTVLRSVPCAVRTESLNIIQVHHSLSKMAPGQSYFYLCTISPLSVIPPILPNHFQLHVAVPATRNVKPG
jgi:hypothetical protein